MPKNNAPSVLTPDWKAALRAGWLEEEPDDEEIDYCFEEGGPTTEEGKLAPHRLGPYLVIPAMSDDSESSVRVLSVVGFTQMHTIDVPISNSTCQALTFMEDPNFVGDRGALIACNYQHLHWQVLLK